jgi:cobalt-zinc-cadmium efflux system outer membrane protein
MSRTRLLALCGLVLVSGCITDARQRADQATCAVAAQPFDLLPSPPAEPMLPVPTPAAASTKRPNPPGAQLDLQTTAFMQPTEPMQPSARGFKTIPVPPELPGAETPPLPKNLETIRRQLGRIYPELPPLPEEPAAVPGPDGNPYTLAALQQLAARNSPTIRQSASDVEAARGNLIQAKAYPNPTVGVQFQPSNDGSTPGVMGPFVDQTVKTAGKLKLAAAAAEVALQNAELSLKRARMDLATQVRNAYYALLVARETVRVTKALARFTDAVYRQHIEILRGAQAAPYEPTALRAQAYTARLAYEQAIQTYIYSWKQLVAVLGLRNLPLSQVAGRIDAYVPYFDYDAVRAHVLANHTDVLIARNGIEQAKYNLQLARINPVPDVDFNVAVLKEYSLPPKQWVPTLTLGFPLPVWDQNRGNIMVAEAALLRAQEEPHRVAESWSNTLAGAYMGYKTSLEALEAYRRYILPDQVQYYRGTFDAYHINPANVPFGNIVAAQQSLASSVTTYLTILGQLWTAVVSVADPLQTDDLFQLGRPLAVPALPDLEAMLAPWPCCHESAPACAGPAGKGGSCPPTPAPDPRRLMPPVWNGN